MLNFQTPARNSTSQQLSNSTTTTESDKQSTSTETRPSHYRHHIKLPKCIENSWLGRRLADNNFTVTTSLILKIILWFLLWGLFCELEFGAVYFATSLMFVVYSTMKSGSRKKGEPSAYSVFNPGCERLEGTFTAEQFEQELRYGAGSVR